VLFDLWVGDATIRPDAAAGYAACVAASQAAPDLAPAEGSVGAGAGAVVGKMLGLARAMKGGVGNAALSAGGVTVAALVAVNAVGDVVAEDGSVLAGARSADGRACTGAKAALLAGERPIGPTPGSATTIGVVATDAVLGKAQAAKLASLAHHGLSRAIDPVTAHDGDTLFALATGRSGVAGDLTVLGVLAAEAVALAIRRAVRAAQGLPQFGLPALRDLD
jgi:L-aminopeptidase/D-esterase-like protein